METRIKQTLIEDAMVIMSGDMFQKIYDLQNDWFYVTNEIKSWAREFVDVLIASGFEADGDDELDFIFELEKFEDKKFETLKQYY